MLNGRAVPVERNLALEPSSRAVRDACGLDGYCDVNGPCGSVG